VIDLVNCPQVYYGMSSNLHKRIAAEPPHQITQRVIGSKFLPHGMNPGATIMPEDRRNLVAGEQTNLVAVYILDGEQFIGCLGKTTLFDGDSPEPSEEREKEPASNGRRSASRRPTASETCSGSRGLSR